MVRLESFDEKVGKAAHLLMYRRGRIPGAKEWELKSALGKMYIDALKRLDEILSELGLEVFKLSQDGVEPRYLVRVKGKLNRSEAKLCGWRIDHLAALAAVLAHIVSKQGKCNRNDAEDLISRKVGRWRGLSLVDGFVKSGYLEEDEKGMLSLGWRTLAEIDLKELMGLILGASQDRRENAEGTPSLELDDLNRPPPRSL